MSFPDWSLSSTNSPSPLSSLSPDSATIILLSSSTPTVSAISSIAATAVAAVAESAIATIAEGDSRSGVKGGECQLLGEASIFIQAALGGLALLSLVYKRWRERPRRPWKIWFFDVSKQVLGSVLLHIANLLMSMLSSGQFEITPKSDSGAYSANPCSFYLLNLAIDTTIGIPILIILLRLLTHVFALTPFGQPPESIQSGNYGRPPKATWWLKQSFIYFLGLLGMKTCVFFIFQLCPWIVRVGDWALKWTKGNKTVQVFFVMLFFPVIMNALQYYIIDGFIKNQKAADSEVEHNEDRRDEGHRTRSPRVAGAQEHNRHDEDGEALPAEAAVASDVEDKPLLANGVTKLKINSKRLEEYDPTTDGESSPASSEIRRRNSPGGSQIVERRDPTARRSS